MFDEKKEEKALCKPHRFAQSLFYVFRIRICFVFLILCFIRKLSFLFVFCANNQNSISKDIEISYRIRYNENN